MDSKWGVGEVKKTHPCGVCGIVLSKGYIRFQEMYSAPAGRGKVRSVMAYYCEKCALETRDREVKEFTEMFEELVKKRQQLIGQQGSHESGIS